MKEFSKELLQQLIVRYNSLSLCEKDILKAVEILCQCYRDAKKLLVCGNGGSATDAQHIVGELMKSFVLPRKLPKEMQVKLNDQFPPNSDYYIENLQQALPSISLLGETALNSAYSNDKAPDLVFAQQVLGLGMPGDVLLGISTSGNSANILYACEIAKIKGMKIIGLVGETGGKMKDLCDVTICVPGKETYKIQELHLPVYHVMCLMLENEFFGEDK